MSKNTKPIGKLYESAVDITATINIEPSTEVDLNEGDVLTADLFTDEDDEELVNLISIADVVAVEEVIGRNAYKVNATINDDVAAISLYQWIYANTNIKNDEDLEEYVAPGLVAVVNAEEGGDVNDDPDATADYEELAAEMDADGDGETYNESVSSKFAKYRKLYESAINEEDEKLNEKDDKGDDSGESNDDWSDIFGDESGDGDDKGGDDKDDKGSDDKDDKGDDDKDSDESGDETEDVPMTAVVLTVGKDDADKCKDEMIEAGIAEDDIEIIDGEDEENSKIKVDVNSVKELKDYLKGKGIDLEEKIGGEIVDDEEGDDNKDDDKEGDDKEGDDKDDKEGGDDDIENMDFGDLFGDDDESSDEGK